MSCYPCSNGRHDLCPSSANCQCENPDRHVAALAEALAVAREQAALLEEALAAARERAEAAEQRLAATERLQAEEEARTARTLRALADQLADCRAALHATHERNLALRAVVEALPRCACGEYATGRSWDAHVAAAVNVCDTCRGETFEPFPYADALPRWLGR